MEKSLTCQIWTMLLVIAMNKFKLKLKLLSAVSTPLAADTLWGHIAWGIRYTKGEGELSKWLEEHDSDNPPLVLSEPYPSGFLPVPVIPRTNSSKAPPKKEEMKSQKENRKQKLVHRRYWENLCKNVTMDSLSLAIDKTLSLDPKPPKDSSKYLKSSATTHAGINRFTGGTQQEDDAGALFSVPSYFPGKNSSYDVYVLSPYPMETVKKWFENGLAAGYGKDASSGKGHIKVLSILSGWEITLPENPNAVMLLSNTTPVKGDPFIGFSKFTSRCGRLGGSFTVDGVPGESTSIQKRPILCLQPGSILLSDSPALYAGRTIYGVHPKKQIRHYAMGICLPVVLSPQLIKIAKAQFSSDQEVV